MRVLPLPGLRPEHLGVELVVESCFAGRSVREDLLGRDAAETLGIVTVRPADGARAAAQTLRIRRAEREVWEALRECYLRSDRFRAAGIDSSSRQSLAESAAG